MIRSKNMIAVGFLALAFLSGCDDSKPSRSTMEKQVADELVHCPLESVVNFQKVNGMIQNDGSYIADVKFTYVKSPGDKDREAYREYKNATADLDKQRNEILEEIQAMRQTGYNSATEEKLEMEGAPITQQLDAALSKYGPSLNQQFSSECPQSDNGPGGVEERMDMEEQLTFIKTDNGWVIQN